MASHVRVTLGIKTHGLWRPPLVSSSARPLPVRSCGKRAHLSVQLTGHITSMGVSDKSALQEGSSCAWLSSSQAGDTRPMESRGTLALRPRHLHSGDLGPSTTQMCSPSVQLQEASVSPGVSPGATICNSGSPPLHLALFKATTPTYQTRDPRSPRVFPAPSRKRSVEGRSSPPRGQNAVSQWEARSTVSSVDASAVRAAASLPVEGDTCAGGQTAPGTCLRWSPRCAQEEPQPRASWASRGPGRAPG